MTERFEGDASGDVADDLGTVDDGVVDAESSMEKRLAAGGRSLPDAGDDHPVRSAVPLSGIELVGIETPRENLAKPDRSPESTDDYHLSGTILPKIVEKQSPTGELCPDCNTTVSHTVAANGGLTPSNSSRKRRPDCHTSVLHNRHLGLWRRGAIYKYRVRIPHALVGILGTSENNRSKQTTSFMEAVRKVRKIAFEIETYFVEVRQAQSFVPSLKIHWDTERPPPANYALSPPASGGNQRAGSVR